MFGPKTDWGKNLSNVLSEWVDFPGLIDEAEDVILNQDVTFIVTLQSKLTLPYFQT